MKRFLKILFKTAVYVFAVIGLLTVLFLIAVNKVGYSIGLNIADKQYNEYVEYLRNYGPVRNNAGYSRSWNQLY